MAKKKRSATIELELEEIRPLTDNQEIAFKSKKNLVMCGSAGTGKSFIACYLGFNAVAAGKYDELLIIRSAVPTRDMGFMPGNEKDKASVYEEPYRSLCSEVFRRGDAYDILKSKNILSFMTTSYIRGLTLRDCYVIVDEMQNMDFGELDSLITRIGEGCRIVFCGDFKQADLKKNGMKKFLSILENMEQNFDVIEFGLEDVVRSGFVKDYLITKERIENA